MSQLKQAFSYRGLAVLSVMALVLLFVAPTAWLQNQIRIFASINKVAPQGKIVRVDLSFLGTLPVLTGLNFPTLVSCGPDGQLYTVEQFRQSGEGRFLRTSPNGGQIETLLEVDEAIPEAFTFDANGNLWVGISDGTILRLALGDPNRETEPLAALPLSPESMAFLTHGPFAGDLLVLDGDAAAVVRLPAPDFDHALPFIDRESSGAAVMDRFAGLAVHPDGDVFVTNFDGSKVHRFDPEGVLLGTFLEVPFPNQLAFDSTGRAYLTNQAFFSGGRTRGGILIVEPDGTVSTSIRTDAARGIAVCEG